MTERVNIKDNRPRMIKTFPQHCKNHCKTDCEYNPEGRYKVLAPYAREVHNIMKIKGCCSYTGEK